MTEKKDLSAEKVSYPTLPELTFRGMFLGMLITIIFTASNVYLGLKVGLTFSSSIPAAIISMAILRFCKNSNILENNMVQTQASAAGTLSAIIFILPGLLMLGYWQGFPFWEHCYSVLVADQWVFYLPFRFAVPWWLTVIFLIRKVVQLPKY